MSKTKIPLSLVKVASPCTAPWEDMSGDDTTRFCGQCAQYVYNLSEMSHAQAEALVAENEGKLCVRYYLRADGTMMTKDCPVGWRALKRRAAIFGGVAVTVVVAMFSVLTIGVFASVRGNGNGGVRLANPIERIHHWLFPPPVGVQGGMRIPVGAVPPPRANGFVMGDICPPQPNPIAPIEELRPPERAVPLVPEQNPEN